MMRRVAVSNPARSARLAALALVLLLPLAAAFAAIFAHLNDGIRTVRIEGRLSAAEQAAVQRAVAPMLRSGFMTVDLESVVDAVLALSWPRQVSVRRVWPQRLYVVVEKETLVARWGVGRALNSAGQVIDTVESVDPALPLIVCTHAGGQRALGVLEMLGRPARERGLIISRLEENDLGEWRVKLAGGTGENLEVTLGREAIAERMERFLTVFGHLGEERARLVESVDARYANGVAVNWRDAEAENMTSLAMRY